MQTDEMRRKYEAAHQHYESELEVQEQALRNCRRYEEDLEQAKFRIRQMLMDFQNDSQDQAGFWDLTVLEETFSQDNQRACHELDEKVEEIRKRKREILRQQENRSKIYRKQFAEQQRRTKEWDWK